MNKDFIDAIFELSAVLREISPPDAQRRIDDALEKIDAALMEEEKAR